MHNDTCERYVTGIQKYWAKGTEMEKEVSEIKKDCKVTINTFEDKLEQPTKSIVNRKDGKKEDDRHWGERTYIYRILIFLKQWRKKEIAITINNIIEEDILGG